VYKSNNYAYQIDGILVSDFITPAFYDPAVTSSARYSFTGAVKNPREILPGGYISWVDPATSEMKQILWVDPSQKPTIRDLGPAPSNMSLREFVETKTFNLVYKKRPAPPRATVASRQRLRAALKEAALLAAGQEFFTCRRRRVVACGEVELP
jgi:hypothetical protein